MKNKFFFIALILFASLINFYCSTAESYLTSKSIPVGGEASFSFKTDRGGGFEWQIKQNSDPTVLGFVEKSFTDPNNGVGNEVFRFKGLKKGTVEVIFTYSNKTTGGQVIKSETRSVTVR